MSKPESFPIDKIYVPVKRKKDIKPELVQEIAGSILDIGQQAPIHVRSDEGRFVLVEGLHRLEACKALGETTIIGVLVPAEFAHHRLLVSASPEVDAERDKMARLKKLRLEKEAADRAAASAVAPDPKSVLRNHSEAGVRSKSRASQAQSSASTPRTLSEWLTQQKRDGNRY